MAILTTPGGHGYLNPNDPYKMVNGGDSYRIALQNDSALRQAKAAAEDLARQVALYETGQLGTQVANLRHDIEAIRTSPDAVVIGGLDFRPDDTDPLLYVPMEGDSVTINGTIVRVTGVKDTAADLPSIGEVNTAFVSQDDGHLHIWGPNGWVDAGPIRGPKGDTGDAGPGTALTVGDVSVADEGEDPGVFITGDAPNQTVSFVLPNNREYIDAAAEAVLDEANTAINTAVAPLTPSNGNRPVGKGEIVVNVLDYGATGDGVTDDTNAIQEALNNSTGTKILFPRGIYRVTAELTIPRGMRLEGDGAVIDGADIPAATALNQRAAFRASGELGAVRNIGTPITRWSRTVAGIDDTTGLNVGDLVLITNDERPVPGMTRTDRDKGELNIVRSVDSATQITLTTGALYDYGTTLLRVRRVNPVRDLNITGLTINLGGVGSGHNGVVVRYGQNIVLDNVTIVGAEDTAIHYRTVWDGQVRGCTVRDSTSSATLGNTGYGTAVVEGSRHCLVTGNSYHNCRHFVAGGGEWAAAFVDVINNQGSRSIAAGFDCHESTLYWKFVRNVATGVATGFIIRGQHITVDGNEVVEASGEALRVSTWDGVTEQRGIRLTDNVFRRCRSGIFVEGRAAGAEPACVKIDLQITGNEVHNATGPGIFVSNFTNALVAMNLVKSPTAEGIRCDGISGSPSTGLSLSGNRVVSAGSKAVLVQNVNNVEVNGGTITTPATYGLEFTACNRTTTTGVTVIEPGQYGVFVNGGATHALNGVHASGGTTSGWDALRVVGSTNVSVNGGYYASARWAIYSTTTSNVIVNGVNARDTFQAARISVDAANQVVANNLI